MSAWKGEEEVGNALMSLASAKGISANRIKGAVTALMKWAKEYKRVVHAVENVMWKADVEHRLAYMYLIDALIRASQAKSGDDKDPFAKRFGQHLHHTLNACRKVPDDAQMNVKRVVVEWTKRNVFTREDIESAGGADFLGDGPLNPSHAMDMPKESITSLLDNLKRLKQQQVDLTQHVRPPSHDDANSRGGQEQGRYIHPPPYAPQHHEVSPRDHGRPRDHSSYHPSSSLLPTPPPSNVPPPSRYVTPPTSVAASRYDLPPRYDDPPSASRYDDMQPRSRYDEPPPPRNRFDSAPPPLSRFDLPPPISPRGYSRPSSPPRGYHPPNSPPRGYPPNSPRGYPPQQGYGGPPSSSYSNDSRLSSPPGGRYNSQENNFKQRGRSRSRSRSPIKRPRGGGPLICRDFEVGLCTRGNNCRFPHGEGGNGNRPLSPRGRQPPPPASSFSMGGPKVKVCYSYPNCRFGDRCTFAHIDRPGGNAPGGGNFQSAPPQTLASSAYDTKPISPLRRSQSMGINNTIPPPTTTHYQQAPPSLDTHAPPPAAPRQRRSRWEEKKVLTPTHQEMPMETSPTATTIAPTSPQKETSRQEDDEPADDAAAEFTLEYDDEN
ncbi:Aste57867_12632 [Aphanomyces stellatus]|uniref:Aste57867_12632 protein n=1 Tax=Aphanomyces stellatus TaxID=120398 RepID=A0A485KWQ7_9STRA|nr:hypothetical protein As57867_012586 [Aphanomyces stellatus]VFT89482.1 Aste57867_12632 [Aphanomyces stellatus]